MTFTHRTGNSLYELSEEYESNGTMRFLGMGIILNFLLKNNQFVPIDEVETSIHYELLSYFIKVFLANSNQTSQMLLTTHDINLLMRSLYDVIQYGLRIKMNREKQMWFVFQL